MTTPQDAERAVFGYGQGDRIAADDWTARDEFNKCDDCCLVVGCDVCGPCLTHDGQLA